MKPFNSKSKMVVTSRFNLLSTLFTYGLLITACNHTGTYPVIQDQGSTKRVPFNANTHRYNLEAEMGRINKLQIKDKEINATITKPY